MDESQRDAIVVRDQFVCRGCGRRTRGQVHHILARGRGGSDSPHNLVTLCGRCHMLVSPIPVGELLAYFAVNERQLIIRRARVELAIQSWVLDASEKGSSPTAIVAPKASRSDGAEPKAASRRRRASCAAKPRP